MNVLQQVATEILNAETLKAAETAATKPGIIGSVESLIGLADRGITLFGQAIELVERVQTMAAMKRGTQELQQVYDVYPVTPAPVLAAPAAPAPIVSTAPEPAQASPAPTTENLDKKGISMKITTDSNYKDEFSKFEIDEETLVNIVIPIGKMILTKYPDITIYELLKMANAEIQTFAERTQLIHNKTLSECIEFAEKEPEMLIRVVNFFA